MSVLSAPPTMNLGSLQISYIRERAEGYAGNVEMVFMRHSGMLLKRIIVRRAGKLFLQGVVTFLLL